MIGRESRRSSGNPSPDSQGEHSGVTRFASISVAEEKAAGGPSLAPGLLQAGEVRAVLKALLQVVEICPLLFETHTPLRSGLVRVVLLYR